MKVFGLTGSLACATLRTLVSTPHDRVLILLAMTDDKQLNERERLILQAVVHTYITTAEAVGSRSIVKRYGLECSPATARNVMSDLEEAGFLQQLHTSSGRVPTQRGYRYYVDYLMRVQELTAGERHRIEQEFSKQLNDADEVMRQTSHLLALVTHHAGLVEAPNESEALVRSAEIMKLGPNRIALLVADSNGRVRTEMVAVEEPIDEELLPKLRAFLNERLHGESVNNARRRVEQGLEQMFDEQRRLAEQALRLLKSLPESRPGQLFLEGATQLFEQPEFRDVGRAREVFHLFEERDLLLELLRAEIRDGGANMHVLIGGDEGQGKLEGISVVASPYRVGEKTVGMLGVLGPRRMPYSKLTAVVDYTANMLSKLLTRLAG